MTTVKVGIPSNDNELLVQNIPFQGIHAYKSHVHDQHDCYIAFDGYGYPHEDDLCNLNTGHMSTLIRYIESVESAQCDVMNSQHKSKTSEL